VCISRERVHERISFLVLEFLPSISEKNIREKRKAFAFLKGVGKEIHLVVICQKRHTRKKLFVLVDWFKPILQNQITTKKN